MNATLPVSLVVPTRDRPSSVEQMVASLARQGVQPQEIVCVDASASDGTQALLRRPFPGLTSRITYLKARVAGAAAQRNQGVLAAQAPFIMFCDDDITFEPDCISRLWAAISGDPALGGVNAMIVNQQYGSPGWLSRMLFWSLSGRRRESYAGMCIGPAFNLLPADDVSLPDVVSVEWLNTTCVIYRREALPALPFPAIFSGYSLLEDVALSALVGKQWRLANARKARIFHDSQPTAEKRDVRRLSRMELLNRYYVMTEVLGRRDVTNHLRFGLLQLFHCINALRSAAGIVQWWALFMGKIEGVSDVIAWRNRGWQSVAATQDGTR